MIPAIYPLRVLLAMLLVSVAAAATPPPSALPLTSNTLPPLPGGPANCMEGGDGYLRAHLAGAIEARIDWPNSGTRCQGEAKLHTGVRMSFERALGGNPNLLFVFGVTGVREGQPARAAGVNLTVILQGTDRIYGTLGDARCTVDSLSQRPLKKIRVFRVEARGFCTQPAHAVRGDGDVLVSTFEFAGPVSYADPAQPLKEASR